MRILSALLVAAALTVPELVGKAEVRASFLSPYSWRIEGVRDRAPAALRTHYCPYRNITNEPAVFGQDRLGGFWLVLPSVPAVCSVKDWNGPLTLRYGP